MGASSILVLAFPKQFQFGVDTVDKNKSGLHEQSGLSKEDEQVRRELQNNADVKGVAVAMITNLTDVGLSKTAHDIANLFKWLL